MSRWDAPPFLHGLGMPLNDARDLVIKVKYGGTLKRFNACVKGSHFDHNLAALRSMISNAFKFSPTDVFVLTYTDEDGDVVMLDDDDDLRDAAIGQKLNPLRIDVRLNSSSRGAKQQASDTRSPMSAAMEEQLAQVKSAIDEALKFVPEQVPAELATLSRELHSEAGSWAPAWAELLYRAELLTAKGSLQSTSVQPTSGLTDSSSGSSCDHLPNLRNLLLQNLRNLLNNHETATASSSHSSDMQSSKALGLKSVLAEDTTPQVGQAPGYASLEDPCPRKKRTDAQSKGKSHAQIRGKSAISSSVPPVPYMAHGVPTLRSAIEYERHRYMPFGSYGRTNGDLHSAAPPPRGHQYFPIPTLESSGKINDDLHSVYRAPLTVKPNGKINGEHSVFPQPGGPVYGPGTTPGFNGMFDGGLQTTSITSPEWNGKMNGGLQTTFPLPPAYDYNPFKFGMHPYGFYQDAPLGSYGFASSAYGSIPQPTVHKWVECDGCRVTPIVGPRYKSIVKDDYDLCSACFSLTGKEAEYTKIDKPMPLSERMRNIYKSQHLKLQLDCRFIKDLTVPDGTVMKPSTPFRKIWCMRNSGSTAWPFGTQLTWTGGDQFARQSSVKLGISEFGFPVGGEIDVCVDFVAPAKPGRYISYWRLTSPDLLSFGQQVWVLIQVEQPVQTSGKNATTEINLNLPADGNPTTSKPSMVEHPVRNSGNKQTAAMNLNLNLPAEGSTTTWTDSSSNSDNDDEDTIDQGDALLAVLRASRNQGSKAVGSVVPCAPTAVEPVQVPITDPQASSAGAVAMPAGVPISEAVPLPKHISVQSPLPAATPVNSRDVLSAAPSPDEVFSDMEEKLLRELSEMGFRQVDLNKEVLRQNEYDLQKSVDDLCGYHEWDLVADLKEMI